MSLDAIFGQAPPLVLLVDPSIATRHWMWRALNRCGVLEAGDVRGAREWIARRPDIDAVVVENDLPDGRGVDIVQDLARARHPVARRVIVLARRGPDWARVAQAGATLIERGDLRSVLAKLSGWFVARDAGLAKALLRDADRIGA